MSHIRSHLPNTHPPNPLLVKHKPRSRYTVPLAYPSKASYVCIYVCVCSELIPSKNTQLRAQKQTHTHTHPNTHRLRVFKSMQVQIVIHGGLIFQWAPLEERGGKKQKECRRTRKEGAPDFKKRMDVGGDNNPFSPQQRRMIKKKKSPLPLDHAWSSGGPSLDGCSFSPIPECCWLAHVIGWRGSPWR